MIFQLLDIDGVLLENKYLHERVKIQDSELELTKQSINKYKVLVLVKTYYHFIYLYLNHSDNVGCKTKEGNCKTWRWEHK